MSKQRQLRTLALQDSYTTSTDNLLDDFLVPCLSQATSYDRLAGFFSGAVVALAPLAFADFFSNGGRVRLICSPHLSDTDYAAVNSISAYSDVLRERAVAELRALSEESPQGFALSRAMSSMVAAGVLQVKIAVPRSQQGLFHDKTGVFFDPAGDRVSFVGSTNESAAAWSGLVNHEQIEVFTSWESRDSSERSRRHARMFEETWRNARRGLRVLNVAEAADLIRTTVPPEPLEDALAAVRDLRRRVAAAQALDRHQPKSRSLLPHQLEVLEHWEGANCKGLVAFATGAGKTLTGIEALRRWTTPGRPALVLVPSELLQQQWASEIRSEFPQVNLLRAGGEAKKDRWLESARAFTRPDDSLGPRCIVTTYQTARTSDFLNRVIDGEHLLLLADEVHRVGAPDTRGILDHIDAGARLGLSATPDRFGDAVGTAAIHSYFGDVLEPKYDLSHAIRDGRLVPYVYGYETVPLDHQEQDEFDQLTRRIKTAAAQERVGASDAAPSDYLAGLLRKRARILKRAAAKVPMARRVLEQRYAEGQRWLVYCESVQHLQTIKLSISDMGLPLLDYHQAMSGDKAATLDYFRRKGGVLLAIKCLDEGVDIPATDHALILASTTNPREYIQRRGRVLRASPDKYHAVVIDSIVVDADGVPLSKSEMERIVEFASQADNAAVKFELRSLLAACGDERWRTITAHEDFEGDEGTD
jgi:superfamily II DNA or RNA helicase